MRALVLLVIIIHKECILCIFFTKSMVKRSLARQLYVAMSRVTAEKNLKVVLNKSGNKYVTRNVIFKSVFS